MNISPHSYCDKSISAPVPLLRLRITAAIAADAPSRDAVFRIVEEGEASAAIVTGTIVLERRILNAKAVGPLARLHVHGAGSEIRQHLSDMRTRGIAAEFEDLEVGQSLRDGGHDCPP